MRIQVEINGSDFEHEVEPRTLLSDFIRHQAGLTGTHVGCEHGVCGACTVLFDAEPVRSCLMFAVQADGHSLETVEGLAEPDGELSAFAALLQRAPRAPVRVLHGRLPDVGEERCCVERPPQPSGTFERDSQATSAGALAMRGSSPQCSRRAGDWPVSPMQPSAG